jgi:hypothetical protein
MPFIDLLNGIEQARSDMKRPVEDVREQDRMRRSLEIELMELVQDAIACGLKPDRAKEAVEALWKQEVRLQESRKQAERAYL